jgi:hypothetical protein
VPDFAAAELAAFIADGFDSLHQSLRSVHRKLGAIMSDQSDIDADVAALTSFVTDVEAEIASLKAANPTVDLSALDALVATVKGEDPGAPVVTPPDPSPVVANPTPDPNVPVANPAPVDAAAPAVDPTDPTVPTVS